MHMKYEFGTEKLFLKAFDKTTNKNNEILIYLYLQ